MRQSPHSFVVAFLSLPSDLELLFWGMREFTSRTRAYV